MQNQRDRAQLWARLHPLITEELSDRGQQRRTDSQEAQMQNALKTQIVFSLEKARIQMRKRFKCMIIR